MTNAINFVRDLLKTQLGLDEEMVDGLAAESPILGAIPEFDSMAVVALVTAIEEQLGVAVEDDEITAEVFETLGSLADFVAERM